MDGHYKIRKASKKDAETILFFINRLADYEKLSDKVNATTDLLIKYGFSDRPFFEALIAKDDQDAPLGLALYFFTFSTFLAKPTLYLEDLFVLPEYRGLGIGKRFFRELVGIAQDYGCGRMEWSVLDWNSPSIEFYKALGAEPVSGWTTYRLDQQALASFDSI
jgi:GNAT superfamily N-acetyltransferase